MSTDSNTARPSGDPATWTKGQLLAEVYKLAGELEAAKRDAKEAYERGRNDQHQQLADAMYPRGRQ